MSRNDELESLLADSALAAIHRDAALTEIEEALRALAELASKSDPIRRAILREAMFRRLRMAGVGSPLVLAEAVFGNPAKRFSAMGTRTRSALKYRRTLAGSRQRQRALGSDGGDVQPLSGLVRRGRRCRGAVVPEYLCL
jgi:hypothetical protein